MGTRGLIAVKVNDRYTVAQYCQFDSYPEGQGIGVLGFLQRHKDLEKLRSVFSEPVIISKEELEEINQLIESQKIDNWGKLWPELSTRTGSTVLWDIYKRAGNIKLKNELSFVTSPLCEWCYVIDLDEEVLEVFTHRGAQRESTRVNALQSDRFDALLTDPCPPYKQKLPLLISRFSLSSLPALDEFIKQTLAATNGIATRSVQEKLEIDEDDNCFEKVNEKIYCAVAISVILPITPDKVREVKINGEEVKFFKSEFLEELEDNAWFEIQKQLKEM